MQKLEIFVDDFNSQGAVKREPLRIGAGGGPDNRFHGSIDDVRIYKRALSPAEAGIFADLTPITAIAALPEDKRTRPRPTRSATTSSSTRCRPNRGGSKPSDGRADIARGVLSKPAHRHGDGGNADAARDAPVDSRHVRQTRRGRHAGLAGRVGVVAQQPIRRIGSAWLGGSSIRPIR